MRLVLAFPGGGLRLDRPIPVALGSAGRGILARASDCLGRDLARDLEAGAVGLHPASAQPAIAALWFARFVDARQQGWTPLAVAGHSAGDWTAAVAAEVMSLEDALLMLVERGRLIDHHCGSLQGTMALLVGPSSEEVADFLDGYDGAWVAALNGRRSTTISATLAVFSALCAEIERKGFAAVKPLHIPFGSHSPLMAEVAKDLARSLAAVHLHRPSCPWFSCSSACEVVDQQEIAAELTMNVRRPVRWFDTVAAIRSRHPGAAFGDLLPGAGLSSLLRDAGVRSSDVRSFPAADASVTTLAGSR